MRAADRRYLASGVRDERSSPARYLTTAPTSLFDILPRKRVNARLVLRGKGLSLEACCLSRKSVKQQRHLTRRHVVKVVPPTEAAAVSAISFLVNDVIGRF
jgi:hypothetical protein